MFIIAGYEDDIESCFFAYNKGLKRRFHSHYKIEGYKFNELKEIFVRKISKTTLKLNVDNEKLNKFFNDNKNKFEFYGGDIEKLINEIKLVQSIRIFNNNIKNNEIIIDDLEISVSNVFVKRDRFDSYSSMYS